MVIVVLSGVSLAQAESYTYGWELQPLFNPPREKLPTIEQLREALSWIVDVEKCEAPVNAVFIPISLHGGRVSGFRDFFITDGLGINISSEEVLKLVDVLDLYTGQRLMVYLSDRYMNDRIEWMIASTGVYDGFIYVYVNESMLEKGYIVIEKLYWRSVKPAKTPWKDYIIISGQRLMRVFTVQHATTSLGKTRCRYGSSTTSLYRGDRGASQPPSP
jgi:hypothetical protein